MTEMQRRTFLGGVAGAALTACGPNTSEGGGAIDIGMKPGQTFPLLGLPALDTGQPASIRALRGKKTLLHIFASW
jgi:hypothetical protein